MPIIKNMNDLDKLLKPYIEKAMILTRDEISDIIQYYIDEYYEEKFFIKNTPQNKPYSYERTNRLKEALSKSVYPVKYSNGIFSFRVGFSENYLDFQYKNASGFEVLGWASEGSHGGIYGNNTNKFLDEQTSDKYGDGDIFFWNDAMEEIRKKYGSIQNMFIANCKKVGLPIK